MMAPRESDEERRFYEKYIKPQMTWLKRIKRKLFGPPKRVHTIDDVVTLDYDLFIKLLCIMMLYIILRMVAVGLYDIYRWFFPGPVEQIARQPWVFPL